MRQEVDLGHMVQFLHYGPTSVSVTRETMPKNCGIRLSSNKSKLCLVTDAGALIG